MKNLLAKSGPFLGLLLVIGDYFLARFSYHLGIRYLKWNIGVITGKERVA